jgi:hypothetical protein
VRTGVVMLCRHRSPLEHRSASRRSAGRHSLPYSSTSSGGRRRPLPPCVSLFIWQAGPAGPWGPHVGLSKWQFWGCNRVRLAN